MKELKRLRHEGALNETEVLERTKACLKVIGQHIGGVAAARGPQVEAPLWDFVSKYTQNELTGVKLACLYSNITQAQPQPPPQPQQQEAMLAAAALPAASNGTAAASGQAANPAAAAAAAANLAAGSSQPPLLASDAMASALSALKKISNQPS